MKIKYPELMQVVSKNSDASYARKLESYLRKESYLSFISDDKKILDVGCYWGITAVYLASQGCLVTGIDTSESAIKHAIEIAKNYSVSVDFMVGDAEYLDFADESFDLVISEETVEHLDSPTEALLEFKRVLRPDGKVIITVPNSQSVRSIMLKLIGRYEKDNCPQHKQNFTISSLSSVLREAGFKNICITSDFIPIPKLPFSLFLQTRRYLARVRPCLGHHIIACATKDN